MNAYEKPTSITWPISNNKFSFKERKNKEIHIPGIVEGNIGNIEEGKGFAFIEIDEYGKEVCCKGLKEFIKQTDKLEYVFDNHNHAFYFSYELHYKTKLKYDFIHIDQHKDLREAPLEFDIYRKNILESRKKITDEYAKLNLKIEIEKLTGEELDLSVAYLYTNTVLNVGNFIKPMINMGMIDKFYCIDSQYSMDEIIGYDCSRNYILDLDLDFFSKDMDYIKEAQKLEIIQKLMQKSNLTLIATSPYFIEFEKCRDILGKLNK
ncbi:MAG: UPF0489 family protein [Proteocatella sp.]